MTDPLKKDMTRNEIDQTTSPRTPLGERLLRIRRDIVVSGEPLLSWREIEHEIAERRGEIDVRPR